MNRLIHILHLEDDPADAELIQAKIKAAGLTCQITCVKARDEFEAALRQGGYDIILADYRLPMYDGMSALRLVQELYPDIPFIFVSGTMGEEAVIEGLTEGATDYVLKQSLSRLASAIPRALQEAENRRERRRVEEELRKLSQAVEQSASTIIITDTQGYIEYANPRFTETTGYTLAEAKGQHTRILKSGHTPPEEYQRLWETITAGNEWHGEFHNKRKNGELYWESASISPIKNAEGIITHFLAVKEDITERKQAEETQAKLEEQLRQAQKMESIGRLAGGVAHDFNNLLTVIQGYCDFMEARIPAQDPLRKELEQIQRAGERAAALTRQLLAFSRKQILAPTVLNLNSLVTNLRKMLERLISEDIVLRFILEPDVWSIVADPGQIEQVIMNLVVNARDAMPTGGTLTIQTDNVLLDDTYATTTPDALVGPAVMLAITDSGQGMDEQTQVQIFEPFFTTKDAERGTGLGLATVYGIVKQSGGNITVFSKPGQGTVFKIFLPANETSPNDLGLVDTYALTQPAIRGGTETILLVEDDQTVRELAQTVLENMGYNVLDACQGDEALSQARQYHGAIHLLVTDVVMPHMSGRELAERLTALRPETKVLFISGYTDDAIGRYGLLPAEIEFLPKPLSPSKLAARVREVLDG